MGVTLSQIHSADTDTEFRLENRLREEPVDKDAQGARQARPE